jgi:Mce-associated membrane protein
MPRGKVRRQGTGTPEPAELAGDAVDPAAPDDEASSDATDEPDTEVADVQSDAEAERQRIVFVERTPPGRRAPIAIGVAAALFVGAGAFAGATLQPYLADRATVDTKLEIARTAAAAVTTLWTYTPDNMEQLANRSAKFLGGDFGAQYRKYIDAIVPTNKQAQVTNNTEVVGTAVESLNGPEATAIVYTNSTSTSPLSKNVPSMRYLSYRLALQRDGANWLVTGMSAITNLNLTPQI